MPSSYCAKSVERDGTVADPAGECDERTDTRWNRAFIQLELRAVARYRAPEFLVADSQTREYTGNALRKVCKIFAAHGRGRRHDRHAALGKILLEARRKIRIV